MAIRWDQTWVGLGVKAGGIAVAGAETFEGIAFRADSTPAESGVEVNVTSIRLGLGLGGSAGVAVFLAFNLPLLFDQPLTDWGVTVALPGGRLSGNIAALSAFKSLPSVMARLEWFTDDRLELLKDIASAVYAGATDVRDAIDGGDGKILVLDVPEAGWGAELSVSASGGELSVGPRVFA
jgi:hypothetical protein